MGVSEITLLLERFRERGEFFHDGVVSFFVGVVSSRAVEQHLVRERLPERALGLVPLLHLLPILTLL